MSGAAAIITTIVIVIIIVIFAVCSIKDDIAPHPLSRAEAIQHLQEIKPYYTYKGATWTALDMAIKAIQREEEQKEHGAHDIL